MYSILPINLAYFDEPVTFPLCQFSIIFCIMESKHYIIFQLKCVLVQLVVCQEQKGVSHHQYNAINFELFSPLDFMLISSMDTFIKVFFILCEIQNA